MGTQPEIVSTLVVSWHVSSSQKEKSVDNRKILDRTVREKYGTLSPLS